MTTSFDEKDSVLLQRLADAKEHSLAELTEGLSLDESAVLSRIGQLQSVELLIHTLAGQRYRLDAGIELLNISEIQAYLPEKLSAMLGISIELSTGSTNTLVAAKPEQQHHGCVVLAETQTAGRGRHGKSWFSPFGRNLYVSLGWRFEKRVAALGFLSLTTGVAVRRALADCGVADVALKWPNDIELEGKKLAGLLIEVTGDAAGPCQAIIGVGINMYMPEATRIDQPWIDLSGIKSPPGRNRLAAAVIRRVSEAMEQFSEHGFAPFQAEWEAADFLQGRAVTVFQGTVRHHGIARGLSESGGLLVRLNDGMHEFHSGEVSVRRE